MDLLPMKPHVLIMLLALVCTPPAAATEVAQKRVTGDALTSLFVGKSWEGIYNDGAWWRESYFVSGRLSYSDERYPRAEGDWFVRDDLICTYYSDDLDGACFVTIRRSENCFDFYPVPEGGTKPEAPASEIAAGLSWSAQGSRADLPSTCPKGLIS